MMLNKINKASWKSELHHFSSTNKTCSCTWPLINSSTHNKINTKTDIASSPVLRVVSLRPALFLPLCFIYLWKLHRFIWDISSLNFLTKTLSIGKMWRFWTCRRVINIYTAKDPRILTLVPTRNNDIVVVNKSRSDYGSGTHVNFLDVPFNTTGDYFGYV